MATERVERRDPWPAGHFVCQIEPGGCSATDSAGPRIRTRPRAPALNGFVRAMLAKAGLRDDTGIDTKSTLLQVSCQPAHASTQRGAEATVGALLQIVGKGSDQQIATEAQRWLRTMPFAPSQSQLVCRSIEQTGDFGFHLAQAQFARLVVAIAALTGNGRRPARVLASRRIVDWRLHAVTG